MLAFWWLIGPEPLAFDRWLLRVLRTPGDPGVPVGPLWLRRLMTEVTALGSGPVLTLAVLAVAGLLAAERRWRAALLTVAAAWSGGRAVSLLKDHVGRDRPTLVPHLVEVGERSFPSGHAASSAVVYLTLAALAGRALPDARSRNYVLGCAVVLVGLIGVSRVFLGVHWPTDVAAGWCLGTLWALAWWRLGEGLRG